MSEREAPTLSELSEQAAQTLKAMTEMGQELASEHIRAQSQFERAEKLEAQVVELQAHVEAAEAQIVELHELAAKEMTEKAGLQALLEQREGERDEAQRKYDALWQEQEHPFDQETFTQLQALVSRLRKQNERWGSGLLEIVRRHPRGCGVIHANREKGWTCRDEQRRAQEKPEQYSEPFGSEVRDGKRLCDVCVAAAALADEESEAAG